jgi:tRNA U34 5-carboxymethylaminomethyl modifying GTPase MnmE/TrmE
VPGLARAAVGTIESADGSVADEVVLVHTSTPEEPAFEVCGHGGAGAVARVLAALQSVGVDAAPPVAPTPCVARARTWLGFRVASFVDEGLLAACDPLVLPLLEPRRVVLAGAPNAGKSSLFNALLERDRALVSSEPGTTRDLIEEETAFEGVPVRLGDTAGVEPDGKWELGSGNWKLGTGNGKLETGNGELGPENGERGDEGDLAQMSAARALRAAGEADLVLRCVDRSCPLPGPPRSEPRTLVVLTKSDLEPVFGTPPLALAVSARTGEGLDALALAIATRILGRDPRTIGRPPGPRGSRERR